MKLILIVVMAFLSVQKAQAAEVSFTMDDPEVKESVLFSPETRNQKILNAFSKHKVKAALFVCGMRIDSIEGKKLLTSWDRQGHVIANHSFSHLSYNAQKNSFEVFKNDFLKTEPLITGYENFKKYFRFPFLKEGNSEEKRESMRSFLKSKGYRQGYVTIDASDWYIDLRLIKKIQDNPKSDLRPYRDFYLKHIWDRTLYYHELAKKVYGREIKHTLLIHHNLLNALFLDDLISFYKNKGWTVISPTEAFKDPVFSEEPKISPAGESVVWASAKEAKKFETVLRYPGEDGDYEKEAMDKLGL